MMKLIDRAHSRFGDFWWWSLCLFIALRCGDAINAFVGLWLVPKYVPQSELGAVLPLLQVTSVFGLPISVLVITFTKFLNQYKTQGEDGKVKSLIRTFWGFAVMAIMLGTGIALWLMPHFFERIRVQSGSLGILIIATAVLSTTAPVFTNALQALKRFRAMTLMNLFTAPLRLAVMLVTMPIRALSGYMVGQAVPYAFQIVWSWLALRHDVRPEIASTPFWREDWRRIVRYALLVLVWYASGTVLGAVQAMIIRQRLPEVESAAYYMISRFAELASYAGLTIAVVLFPLAAESHANGRDSMRLLWKSTLGTLAFSLLAFVAIAVVVPPFFRHAPGFDGYLPYVPDMLLLAVVFTGNSLVGNFCSFEAANDRFRFLAYGVPLTMAQMGFIVCFTGCEYFRGLFPGDVVDWMQSLRIATLRNLEWIMLATLLANLMAIGLHLVVRARRR